MPWSGATIPSRETDAMAADKPLLLCANELRTATTVEWRTLIGMGAGSSVEDSDYPVDRLYDGFTDAQARTTSVSLSFLNIDRGAGTLADIDCMGLLLHDLATVTTNIRIIIADSSDFLTNQQTILNTTVPAGVRAFFLSLGTLTRYSDVRYLSVRISTAAPRVNVIGELFIGKRIQLEQVPMVGWDEDQSRSNVARFTSQSGKVTNYTLNEGQRLVRAELEPYEDETRADVQRVWDESTYGTEVFLWCDKPASAPDSFVLLLMDTEWSFPWQGPFRRTATISADEQGPDFITADGA